MFDNKDKKRREIMRAVLFIVGLALIAVGFFVVPHMPISWLQGDNPHRILVLGQRSFLVTGVICLFAWLIITLFEKKENKKSPVKSGEHKGMI